MGLYSIDKEVLFLNTPRRPCLSQSLTRHDDIRSTPNTFGALRGPVGVIMTGASLRLKELRGRSQRGRADSADLKPVPTSCRNDYDDLS